MKDWSTPFDTSMLDRDLLIRIPTQELADELAYILDEMGIVWGGGLHIPGHTEWYKDAAWKYYPDEKTIRRSTVNIVDTYREYDCVPRCTFSFTTLDDVDIPDDVSLF